MRKEYTVKEAAKILGMGKQSLHTLIDMGAIKASKRKVNGVGYLFISGKDLEKYAHDKIERLQRKIDDMRMDLLIDEGEDEVS